MSNKLIQIDDDFLIEVEVPENEAKPISGKYADKVSFALNKIKPILIKVCTPVVDFLKEVSPEVEVEKTEIQIGFSFESQGNLYVTKVKSNSTLNVKLTLKPRND